MEDLRKRWASIVEADADTDGFWIDIAKFYDKRNDEGLTREFVGEVGRECIRRVAAELRRSR
jgi:hypothetical protein